MLEYRCNYQKRGFWPFDRDLTASSSIRPWVVSPCGFIRDLEKSCKWTFLLHKWPENCTLNSTNDAYLTTELMERCVCKLVCFLQNRDSPERQMHRYQIYRPVPGLPSEIFWWMWRHSRMYGPSSGQVQSVTDFLCLPLYPLWVHKARLVSITHQEYDFRYEKPLYTPAEYRALLGIYMHVTKAALYTDHRYLD